MSCWARQQPGEEPENSTVDRIFGLVQNKHLESE
jgi:hypothetical protein